MCFSRVGEVRSCGALFPSGSGTLFSQVCRISVAVHGLRFLLADIGAGAWLSSVSSDLSLDSESHLVCWAAWTPAALLSRSAITLLEYLGEPFGVEMAIATGRLHQSYIHPPVGTVLQFEATLPPALTLQGQ